MKKLAAILCVAAFTVGAFAQGTINLVNNNTWLVSAGGTVLPAGQPATYWFTVLAGPANTTDLSAFLQTGVYGTNQNNAGRVFGGSGVTANNWPAGADRAFTVAGWSANLGNTFNPAWLTGNFGSITTGFFGLSPIAPVGTAGGTVGSQNFPALNIWGGTQGLTSGFNLLPVPEPTTFALMGLGAAALLIFRRKI